MATISRRQAIGAAGTVGIGALLAACGGGDDSGTTTTTPVGGGGSSAPSGSSAPAGDGSTAALFDESTTCTLTPEQMEGPYWFDVDSIRRDIREDREGTPLRVGVRVRSAAACEPIESAVVELWHCDAAGTYSGFEAASAAADGGAAPGIPGARAGQGRSRGVPTDDGTYLRGAQVTGADGITELLTIYPGWYPGRTVHIHAKVHVDNTTVLTTQLYLPDDLTDEVLSAEPYASEGERSTRNDDDAIFDEATVMTVRPAGDGYLALITLDVDTA